MGLFQCERCGCAENTALGHYHCRDWNYFKDTTLKGLALCSACAPQECSDGSIDESLGKWHGRFPRTYFTLGSLETDERGNLRSRGTKIPLREEWGHSEPLFCEKCGNPQVKVDSILLCINPSCKYQVQIPRKEKVT